MLDLVTIPFLASIFHAPDFLPVWPVDLAVVDVGPALGAVAVLAYLVPAVGNVPALTKHLPAIRVGQFDKMMVKDLTGIRTSPHPPSSHTISSYRESSFHPIAYIDVMNMLFINKVSYW